MGVLKYYLVIGGGGGGWYRDLKSNDDREKSLKEIAKWWKAKIYES